MVIMSGYIGRCQIICISRIYNEYLPIQYPIKCGKTHR
jgi:hypothetical protein